MHENIEPVTEWIVLLMRTGVGHLQEVCSRVDFSCNWPGGGNVILIDLQSSTQQHDWHKPQHAPLSHRRSIT